MLGAVVITAQTLDPIIQEISQKYNVPVALIKSIIKVESNWDMNASRYESRLSDTSWGLMQVLLRTARGILKKPNMTISELIQPKNNIEAGTAYLSYQLNRYKGNIPDAIAAYNAGTAKFNPVTRMYSNQGYVNSVYGNYVVYKTTEMFTISSGLPLLAAVGIIGMIAYSGGRNE